MTISSGKTARVPIPPRCPNCGSDAADAGYSVRGIPVHSCLLVDTKDAAKSFPQGDLELAGCPACGFLFNRAFDVANNAYSEHYEETQGFSPTFNGFAQQLARDVVDKHALRGRTVLEIGCGKGEFLAALCAYGQCRGIGIDPAFRPDRMSLPGDIQIEWIQDLYDRRYSHLEADCIVCRHTLEHIAPTQRFMQELRETIGERTDTVVFFELPDMLRILNEAAFWDIYYEHCSYFTSGSLARLFRATGFEVTHLERVYDDQYLLITAMPSNRSTTPEFDLEYDLKHVCQLVQEFPGRIEQVQAFWRTFLDERDGQSVVLWGSGSKGVSFLTTLGISEQIGRVVDINPHKHGKFMPGSGHEIVSPQSLADAPPNSVVVMNPIYVNEITADLAAQGLHPEIVAVGREDAAALEAMA